MEQFTLNTADGAALGAYRALPEGRPRAVVQLAHGMAEHLGRYERLARALSAAGYAVYGADHRGHGRSAEVHGLGSFGPGGFQRVVDDMAEVSELARREQPGAPLVLLGHSMGSFASQLYILDHGADLAGLVLSGTAAMDLLVANGPPGGLEAFNAGFEPRTGFEWLSRDAAEVDAYLADPLCGFALDEGAMQTMFGLGVGARGDPRLANLPKTLPVYVISGEVDPIVGPDQAFARALIDSYAAAGLRRIDHRVYPGGRHEMFNETCRGQVEAELVAWLDRAVG
jgi:alpha-beta hydrolase superfamily lysophospholipase